MLQYETEIDRLMDRYADGDDAAFAGLYDLLAPRLQSFVRRRADSHCAEDVVQQTFLSMHRARGTFVRGGRAAPWAYAIARRLLVDEFRKSRRGGVSSDEADAIPDEGASPAKAAMARQTTEQLASALETLPEGYREAFALVNYDGLNLRDAAAVLGTTTAAVKLRLFRTRLHLRNALTDQVEPWKAI